MIRSARSVFCPPAFTEDELVRIFAAAQGKTLYFGSVDVSARPCLSDGLRPALLAYARSEDWRSALPVSVRRFYQVLASTRDHCSTERVLTFQREGLSLRQLAVLYNRSVPTIQRLLNGESDSGGSGA